MSDQRFVIDLGADGQAVVEAEDRPWLEDKLRREPGSTRLRLKPDDYDTEGHGNTITVRVIADDGDDTEGHALSIHFPSTAEADAFRKRLMLTGVVVGAVALGAVSGAGLASIQVDAGAATTSAATAADPDRDIGLMDFGGASAAAAAGTSASTASDADRDVGLMDFGGAASAASAATTVSDADRDIGLMDFGGAAPAADADEEISGGPSIGGPTPR